MKRFLFNLLRIGISVGLLAYLVYQADLTQLLQILRRAEVLFLGIAVFLFCSVVFVLSVRWRVLLKTTPDTPGVGKLLIFYLIGFFFNNFLPTSIGGDVSRIFYLTRQTADRSMAIGSVFMERVLGLLATLTLASLSMFWVQQYFYSSRIIFVTLGMLLLVGFILGNFLNPYLYKKTSELLAYIKIFKLGDRINEVLARLHAMRESRSAIILAFLMSLGSQLLLILMNYSLAQALGLQQVTIGFLVLVIPVTFVISLVPSINGLGVRDFGYVFLLTRIGVNEAEALSLSVLNTLVPLLVSLLGGILLIFFRQKPASENSGESPGMRHETPRDT